MFDKLIELFRRPKPQAVVRSAYDNFWYYPITALSAAGVPVTPENALKVSAIWACNKVISETVALLPFIVYRRADDGGKSRYQEHYLYSVLKDRPNRIQTSYEWRETLQTHLNLYGNAYSLIRRNYVGDIQSFSLPIHPTKVKVELLENETLRYKVRQGDQSEKIYLQDEIMHLRGTTLNGYMGVSPIDAGSNSIGLAIAAELFGSKFFDNSARPSCTLTHPATLNQQAQDNLRNSVKAQGDNGILILEEGMKYEKSSTTNEEAQFLQTRQFQIEEVARWYRMPLHKIEHLLHATFSNIEHQALEFVTDTILPQVRRWEQRINTTIIDDDDVFCEMLLEGLLRGDTKTRMEAYNRLYTIGAISSNEIRILENMNPYEGGDDYYRQLNMAIVGEEENEPEPPQLPEPEPEPDDSAELINNMVMDAATRIANAERREVEKIGQDKKKLDAFYEKHFEYVKKTLAPLGVDVTKQAIAIPYNADAETLYTIIIGAMNYETN